MKKMILKNCFREIKKSFGRFFAIFAIVTFPIGIIYISIKTFKDVNYYANGSSMTGGVSHNYIQWCGEVTRTTNSVTYYGSVNRYWYACGYIH